MDWENLPVVRDPMEYGYDFNYDFNWEDEEEEEEYSEDNYSYFKNGDKVEKLYIATSQIEEEKSIIKSWLVNSNAYTGFKSIKWNGHSLYVETDKLEFIGQRTDIIDVLPELGSVPQSCLRKINWD